MFFFLNNNLNRSAIIRPKLSTLYNHIKGLSDDDGIKNNLKISRYNHDILCRECQGRSSSCIYIRLYIIIIYFHCAFSDLFRSILKFNLNVHKKLLLIWIFYWLNITAWVCRHIVTFVKCIYKKFNVLFRIPICNALWITIVISF